MKYMKWMLVFAFAFSAWLMGQPSKPIEKGHKSDCQHMKCTGLALTEEQQKKVETLKLDLHKALVPLKADLKVKQAELEKLLVAENPSQTAIEKKIEEIGTLRTQIQKALVHHRLQVREILTPEQRIKFDKMPHQGCNMEQGMKARKGMHPLSPPCMEEPLEE